jgi:hypothetical protein
LFVFKAASVERGCTLLNSLNLFDSVLATNFLSGVNLSSQSSSDDVAAHVFNTIYKKLFKLFLFHSLVNTSSLLLGHLTLKLLVSSLHCLNLLVVISFKHLNVSSDLGFDSFTVDSRVHHNLNELLKLQVFSWDSSVSACRAYCRFVSVMLLRVAVLRSVSRGIIRVGGVHFVRRLG